MENLSKERLADMLLRMHLVRFSGGDANSFFVTRTLATVVMPYVVTN